MAFFPEYVIIDVLTTYNSLSVDSHIQKKFSRVIRKIIKEKTLFKTTSVT